MSCAAELKAKAQRLLLLPTPNPSPSRRRRAFSATGRGCLRKSREDQMRGVTDFEHHTHKVIARPAFARRMAYAVGLWALLTLVGLGIGMVGYMATEGMSLADAYVNAAMILSGMGPVTEMKTTAGKIFAGSYAIFSGL